MQNDSIKITTKNASVLIPWTILTHIHTTCTHDCASFAILTISHIIFVIEKQREFLKTILAT